MRRVATFILSVLMVITLCIPGTAVQKSKSNDIVIIFTNDIHANVDKPMSYETVSALKKKLEEDHKYVLLVDAGDHIQGAIYGAMDQGASIVALMNRAGYDLAIPGNHEFDYGMDVFLKRVQEAKFPYISCNLFGQAQGIRQDTVLDAFAAYHFGKEIIGVIGITTPESITKSAPSYFQDENGDFCYDISRGEDGEDLYATVQDAVDMVRRAGATKVIAIGHLGDDLSSSPWTSEEVIGHVSGIDAFIDGHSHSENPGRMVSDAQGNQTLLAQTGTAFQTIGIMIIDYETGDIRSDLISCEEILKTEKNRDGTEKTSVKGYRLSSELYSGPAWLNDYTIAHYQNSWIKKVNQALKQKVGKTKLVFDNFDEDGTRLVRKQETNTGDFAADALYYLFDQMGLNVDAAIMNGGGLRNQAITGDMTYKTCKSILPFGNVACLQVVTGQQLLDALEWGARFAGSKQECGGFMQVSGIRYQIDTQWPDSTQKDDKGIWIGGPINGYRVHDVEIYDKTTDSWKALDTEAAYRVAGYRYTLKQSGDGFAMFSAGETVADYVMEDYLILANYVQAFENQEVLASNSPLLTSYPGFAIDYGTVNGSGRIVNAPTDHTPEPEETTAETTGIPEPTEVFAPEKEAEEEPSAPFPALPLAIAIVSPALIVCLVLAEKKKKTQKED